MYIVKYKENGEEKQTEPIEDRDEAFLFQTGLIARRKEKADGTYDVEPLGVWNTDVPRGTPREAPAEAK